MIRAEVAMLLERVSPLKLGQIEPVLRRAAWRHRASVSAVEPAGAATVFTILQPDLYARLLSAEIRFAAFLPCRIAAFDPGAGVKLATASPVQFAGVFRRPELDALASALENLLIEFLEDATRPVAMAAGTGGHAESRLGATEDQMNMRGTVTQKVEELAGTGEQDSPGG